MKIVNKIPPILNKDTLVALDIEMFGQELGRLHRPHGTFACLSVCFNNDVYQIYKIEQIKPTLKAIDKATWVFHNALYDLIQLRRFVKISPRFIWDVMLVDQSMCGGLYRTFSLKDLVRRWLGEYMKKDVRDNFETATSMSASMKTYAAKDALDTLKVAKLQKDTYSDDPAFRAYLEIDEPLIFPVLDMPGISVDVKGWKPMVENFHKLARELEDQLGLNSKSPDQVKAAAKKHGIILQSTGKDVLKEFSSNPFISKVLEARKYRTAVSNWGMDWLDNVESDGKVHCAWHITGAETGRMSASNPGMHQIPARELPIYRLRFIPSDGHVMIVSDINQHEPRILAYESGDDELVGIFKRGEDSHLEVARSIFNEPNMKKDDPRRKNEGKTINLGTSYGLSEFGLARKLGISNDVAAKFLRAYFSRFRGVFSWMSLRRMFAHQNGYVKTAVGRRIYLNPYSYQFGNNAINAPIQGGASDFTKMWTRRIWEKCKKHKIEYPIVAIVHDELVADVPKECKKAFIAIVKESLTETGVRLYPGIPFVAEVESGKSWGCKQFREELDTEDL
jgi:DNA polymerase-1